MRIEDVPWIEAKSKMEVDTLIEAASLIKAASWFMAAYWGLLRNGGWVTYCLHHNLSLHHILRLLQLNVSHLHSYMTTSLLIILNLWQHACSVPKYLRISPKHAYAEFFQQGTPHYLREVPHNSAKGIKIIGTSANKGEDELKTMADLTWNLSIRRTILSFFKALRIYSALGWILTPHLLRKTDIPPAGTNWVHCAWIPINFVPHSCPVGSSGTPVVPATIFMSVLGYFHQWK